MQVTLKMVEKMDNLLDEAEEYVKCASTHADDTDLKSAYLDLARCHYDGYEKLAQCASRTVDRRASNMGEGGHTLKEMVDWHKNKFTDRAKKIKEKMDHIR